MALKDYLPSGVQAFGAIMGMARGERDARLLRAQGRVAQAQSRADADAISREYRQLAGRQAASIAQAGGTYDGSAAKVLHQSESLAFLDRLNTLYHGNMRKAGLFAEASATSQNANVSGMAQLLGIGSGLYTKHKTKPRSP